MTGEPADREVADVHELHDGRASRNARLRRALNRITEATTEAEVDAAWRQGLRDLNLPAPEDRRP